MLLCDDDMTMLYTTRYERSTNDSASEAQSPSALVRVEHSGVVEPLNKTRSLLARINFIGGGGKNVRRRDFWLRWWRCRMNCAQRNMSGNVSASRVYVKSGPPTLDKSLELDTFASLKDEFG